MMFNLHYIYGICNRFVDVGLHKIRRWQKQVEQNPAAGGRCEELSDRHVGNKLEVNPANVEVFFSCYAAFDLDAEYLFECFLLYFL